MPAAVRSAWATASCRCGPVGWLSVHGVGRPTWSPPSSATPCRTSRRRARQRPMARSRSEVASVKSCRRFGAGDGNGTLGDVGAASTNLAKTASPPIPSARTWCMTRTSALRPSCRPLTTVMDHSGRSRGSGRVAAAAAISRRAARSPAAGQRRSSTWCSIGEPDIIDPHRSAAPERCSLQPLTKPGHGGDAIGQLGAQGSRFDGSIQHQDRPRPAWAPPRNPRPAPSGRWGWCAGSDVADCPFTSAGLTDMTDRVPVGVGPGGRATARDVVGQ